MALEYRRQRRLMPVTFKVTNIKIPQIVRWRVSGIGDKKIAELMHMTPSGLAQLLATPDYQDAEKAYMDGHLSDMDRAMAGKVAVIKQGLREAVPAALRTLVDTVTQRRDMKAAFMAAKEILDRDPDRSLPTSSDDTNPEAPNVPDAVLAKAIEEGNKTAANYEKDAQKKVN